MKTDEQALSNPGMRSMRKITSFTTAAFDPSWSDRDELIFSAFEGFSFQLKRISSISALYDSSAVRYAFRYEGGEPWVPKKIESPSVIG